MGSRDCLDGDGPLFDNGENVTSGRLGVRGAGSRCHGGLRIRKMSGVSGGIKDGLTIVWKLSIRFHVMF